MSKTQIDKMVNRFLAWPMPKDFAPDCGISFKREPDAKGCAPAWPVGTNLFTADQARQMFEHCLFSEALSGLQLHQQRVVDEKVELDKKVTALSNFIGLSPIFDTLDPSEQERLKEQNDVMWQYSEILGARIAAFAEVVRHSSTEPKAEWFMHVLGPDDVFPCVGEFDALRKANQHNRSWARLMADDPKPNDPYCVAVAVTREDI